MATISNSTAYSLLSGTAYNDTITNTGHHVTILAGAYAYIDAGDGNDTITNYDASDKI